MHCVWTLPENDVNFSLRWRLIKSGFARQIPSNEYRSKVRQQRGERGIWQRKFWEHTIREDKDYEAHVNYVHLNPVKHGYADDPSKWPYSSYARLING